MINMHATAAEQVPIKRPILLRKRFIPDETVELASDELLYRDDSLLITKWRTIRPKPEFASGVSYYFLDENYKISRFYRHDGTFVCWYCDIVTVEYDAARDSYLFSDLLLDIKLYPDGAVFILDEDELFEALSLKLITKSQCVLARRTLDMIIEQIRRNSFPPAICFDSSYW